MGVCVCVHGMAQTSTSLPPSLLSRGPARLRGSGPRPRPERPSLFAARKKGILHKTPLLSSPPAGPQPANPARPSRVGPQAHQHQGILLEGASTSRSIDIFSIQNISECVSALHVSEKEGTFSVS